MKKKLFLILTAAFLIRLVFVLTLKSRFYFDDEFEYHKMIVNFLAGDGLIVSPSLMAFRPPLFPLLASAFYAAGWGLVGVRILNVLVSTATVALIYFIGRKYFTERVGLWSAAAAAVWPFFIFYNGFLLTETLFVFLTVLSVAAAMQAGEDAGMRSSVLAGVYLGLAGLCRPTMEMFVPVVLVMMFLACGASVEYHPHPLPPPSRGRVGVRGTGKKILVIAGVFLVVLSPWVVRNYRLFHGFVPGTTMGGRVFWEGNNPYSEGGPSSYFPYENPDIKETQRYNMLYGKTYEEVIRATPGRFLWLLGNKFVRFWNVVPNASGFSKPLYRWVSVLSFGVLMPFFLLGFLVTLPNRRLWMIHALIIFFTVFHMAFLASIRYRVPIEPFYIILAVYGIAWFGGKIKVYEAFRRHSRL